MANPWFRFKQFTISQEGTAFRVGTDAVLLGAWADVSGAGQVLDIGTGTGLLALMLAQRSGADITAIEIDRASYEQALENADSSPWKDRIKVIHSALQDFRPPCKYDLVVTNPPFFRNSLHPAEEGKAISKHDALLSLEESRVFERLGSEEGLQPGRILGIRPNPGHPVKRRLMEFSSIRPGTFMYEEIAIEKEARHDYTEEYRDLTKDFYLDF